MAAVVGMSAYLASENSLSAIHRTFREGLFHPPPFLKSTTEDARRGELGLPRLFTFDANFFKVLPADATLMDPQQRKLAECVADCFMDAGIALDHVRTETEIGCFVGCGVANYLTAATTAPATFFSEETRRYIGNDLGCLALRTSYLLDLTGPALSVQSTCSSGLLAVHLATQQVDRGEIHLAIAAGCNVDFLSGIFCQESGGIMSPTGSCRPLSAAADGTFFSNGICSFLIASDEAIERFALSPYARVLASGANNDGRRKAGFTAPSLTGQASLIASVAQRAKLHRPPDVVELHGTGTKVGDPIEIAALAQGYATIKGGPIIVTSGKSNYGHLNAAAGALGLYRLLTSIDERTAFASVGCQPLTSAVQWHESRLKPADSTTPIDARSPIGAVSAFGIGGTNVHMLLQAEPLTVFPAAQPYVLPLLIGSHAAELLDEQARLVIDALPAGGQLDAEAAAQTCRRLFGTKPLRSLLLVNTTARESLWHVPITDLRIVTGDGVRQQEFTVGQWEVELATPNLLVSQVNQERTAFTVPSLPYFSHFLAIALVDDRQRKKWAGRPLRGVKTAFRQTDYRLPAYADL